MTALAGITAPSGFGYNPNRKVEMGPRPTMPSNAPQTGQIGAESAIRAALSGQITALDGGQAKGVESLVNSYRGAREQDAMYTGQAIDASNAGYSDALSGLSGYANGGAEAQSVQAALSGALGPIEQERAMANFSSSPGQQFLIDRSERAIRRNAAATGGLGGGNVLKELQRNSIGLAAQDFDNNFNRLSTVADRGLNAAGTRAGLSVGKGATAADLLSGMGARQTTARLNAGSTIAGMQNQAGRDAAGAFGSAGAQLAGSRLDTGNRIADSIAQTTQQVAANQDGGTLASLLGGSSAQLGNLILQAQNGDAAALESLAALYGNMAVGAGSNAAGVKALPGIQQSEGMIGGISQAAGGIGSLLAMFSDERLKENITPIGKIGGHQWYEWDWNEKGKELTGKETGRGVLAQEAKEIDPAAVGEMDGYMFVDYGRILNA